MTQFDILKFAGIFQATSRKTVLCCLSGALVTVIGAAGIGGVFAMTSAVETTDMRTPDALAQIPFPFFCGPEYKNEDANEDANEDEDEDEDDDDDEQEGSIDDKTDDDGDCVTPFG